MPVSPGCRSGLPERDMVWCANACCNEIVASEMYVVVGYGGQARERYRRLRESEFGRTKVEGRGIGVELAATGSGRLRLCDAERFINRERLVGRHPSQPLVVALNIVDVCHGLPAWCVSLLRALVPAFVREQG